MYAMKRTRADLDECDEAMFREVKRQCRASSAAAFAAAFEEERLAAPCASAAQELLLAAEARRPTSKRTSEGEDSEVSAAKRTCPQQPSPHPAPPRGSAATEQSGPGQSAPSGSYLAGFRKGVEVARLHAERIVVPRAVECHSDHLAALFRQVIQHERARMVAAHDQEMAAVMGFVGGQLRTQPWGC